jgi:hypothetical protein
MRALTTVAMVFAGLLSGTGAYAAGDAAAGKTAFEASCFAVPHDRGGEEWIRSLACRSIRSPFRHPYGLQLLDSYGERRSHLGCTDPRCVSY